MKSLNELINTEEPGIEIVNTWIAEGCNTVEVLPSSKHASDLLYNLQITTRSPMGAIAFETGGILIDNGWLRIRGSGNNRLPRPLCSEDHQKLGYIFIADDAVGGVFALNGGALGADMGNVYYASPDTTEWEPLEVTYSDFLSWSFTSGLSDFYIDLRWSGWEEDIKKLAPDQCFGFYPFLWSEEGDIESAYREPIKITEAWNLRLEFIQQIG